MNDELARELVELQREQNMLLKKHLWRLRFSLLTLLLLTTASAVCLGLIMVQLRNQTPGSGTIKLGSSTITLTSPWSSSGSGTLRINASATAPTTGAPPELNSPPENANQLLQ
jgi:hypothetical protein